MGDMSERIRRLHELDAELTALSERVSELTTGIRSTLDREFDAIVRELELDSPEGAWRPPDEAS